MPTTRTAGTPFTHAREVIMTASAFKDGLYFGETDVFGTAYETVKDALKAHLDDDVAKFIRFDLDALHGEDVTEQMASAFLEDFDRTPEDEDVLPTFVRTSDAWETWCESYRIENGFGHNSAARLQRHYGTMSHSQQGLVHGAVLR